LVPIGGALPELAQQTKSAPSLTAIIAPVIPGTFAMASVISANAVVLSSLLLISRSSIDIRAEGKQVTELLPARCASSIFPDDEGLLDKISVFAMVFVPVSVSQLVI
jgi:hypothetical protein